MNYLQYLPGVKIVDMGPTFRDFLPDEVLHLCDAVPPDPGGGDHPDVEPEATPGPHPLLFPLPATTDWKKKKIFFLFDWIWHEPG